MSNYEMIINCLKRATEVVENSKHATEISIEIETDLDSIPMLRYCIKELAPNSEGE